LKTPKKKTRTGELISSDGAAPSSEPSRRSTRGANNKSYIEVSDDEKTSGVDDADEVDDDEDGEEDEDEDEEMVDADKSEVIEKPVEQEEESGAGAEAASSPSRPLKPPQHRTPKRKSFASRANNSSPPKSTNGSASAKKTNGSVASKKTNGISPAPKAKATPSSAASSRPTRTPKVPILQEQATSSSPEHLTRAELAGTKAKKDRVTALKGGRIASKPKEAAKTTPVAKANGKAARNAKKKKVEASEWDVPESDGD
jgi:sister-chromatid-cohesion protein PDS5